MGHSLDMQWQVRILVGFSFYKKYPFLVLACDSYIRVSLCLSSSAFFLFLSGINIYNYETRFNWFVSWKSRSKFSSSSLQILILPYSRILKPKLFTSTPNSKYLTPINIITSTKKTFTLILTIEIEDMGLTLNFNALILYYYSLLIIDVFRMKKLCTYLSTSQGGKFENLNKSR